MLTRRGGFVTSVAFTVQLQFTEIVCHDAAGQGRWCLYRPCHACQVTVDVPRHIEPAVADVLLV